MLATISLKIFIVYLTLKIVCSYHLRMSGQKFINVVNMITANVVVLLLVVALIHRTSAQHSWHDYFAAKLSYHHVHHSADTPHDEEGDLTAPETRLPHHHDDHSNAKEHRHCHTHGNIFNAGELLYFTSIDFDPVVALFKPNSSHFTSSALARLAVASDLFRPPINV